LIYKKGIILFNKYIVYSEMFGKKGQIATEYIIITGFILVVVTIIFTYSYVTNTQSIKISQANNALDKLINKADLVYALGPDNNQFVDITWPKDVTALQDITICNNGDNEHFGLGAVNACSGRGGVKSGAIELELGLIAGTSTVARPAKGEIELDIGIHYLEDEDIPITEGLHKVKVYWCEEKICLKRA